MLRDLITITLLINSVLLLYAGHTTSAIFVILLSALVYTRKITYSHTLNKELAFLGSQLVKSIVAIFGLTILVILSTSTTIKGAIPFYAAITLALMPSILLFSIDNKLAKSISEIGQFRVIRIIRSLFVVSFSELTLITFGVVGLALFHLQPAVNLMQVIAIEMVLIVPLYAFRYDKNTHKLLRVNDRNLRNQTLGKKPMRSYLGHGLLVAILSYLSYLALFWQNNLSPGYIDPSLPLYEQALAVVMVTFVFCTLIHLLFERVKKHTYFINEHTLENKKLLQSFLISLAILVFLIYTPGVNSVFGIQPLGAIDWLIALSFAILYFIARMTHRHTRKHSRRSVIKLHLDLKT